ncbi:MAG: dUTP diphosphatase [Christensenellaceae bacterium]|nr:dUTP diphosphatase [Christensenellaceae bacterium]
MTIARFDHVSEAQFRQDAAHLSDPLLPGAIPLPARATAGSAGYDFVCPAEVTLAPGESIVIPTGVRAFMEPGWVLLIFPRSGLGFKHHMRLANTTGVIDSDYVSAANEGHIMVKIVNGSDHGFTLRRGERFCQGVFVPYGLAEEAGMPGERSGGLGSTGR